ncbi:hypothetical protein [Bdellovibrio sp. HCB-162]|uniref:hypothetical protein n=1 Tax=Bdellovibrio sp. HCB-162 TaxID=3394234 RepID=UPI0039BC78E4
MKFYFVYLLLLLTTTAAHAQLDLAQSPPSIKWETISNDSVQVIYPDYLQAESVYIANLVEHYSKFVGQTYGIEKPEQFNLVIRPQIALPNGFVTLAPRRSEWFTSSTFFPFVGSTEWYQTLSIHEYRHVNQFDHFNHRGTRFLYYIMGDMGVQLATALSIPSWFMEGDAVWTETKYTDAGRGRSPRFMARLKALVLSGEIPIYDEFLNGTYKTNLPNQYVYGYALISYGTNKYGEELWKYVLEDVSRFPIPLRLYVSFKRVTGQDFRDFYNEAMNDLKTKWAADAPPTGEAKVDFRENLVPVKVGHALYYVGQTLDTYPTLYKEENGKKEKIAEISFNKEFMQLHIGKNKAVMTEFNPDKRYAHKGFSELVLLDLKTGKKNRITHGQILYNPSLNEAETKILATDFRPDQSWNISEFDLQGNLVQTIALPDSKVSEARYLNDQTVVAIIENKTGYKSIVVVDLQKKAIENVLVPPSRNLLYSLHVDKNKNLFFEAQYKGHNEIFMMNGSGFAQCTHSKLGAYMPWSDGTQLYYSNMDTYGSTIATANLPDCQTFSAKELVDFNYLDKSPSDNYNDFPPQGFPEQESLYTKSAEKYKPAPYGDFDRRLAIPHTWGLNIGRGGGLVVKTDNYLRTLGFTGQIGTDAEEMKSFGSLSFDIKKYYPLINLEAETRGRKVTDFDTDDELEWTENAAGLGVSVPYIKKSGLYNFTALLNLRGFYTDTSEYELNKVKLDGSSYFYKTSSSLGLSWSKDPKARSIMAPWLLSYKIQYDDADQPSDSLQSSYRVLQEANLQTPGLFANDGFAFTLDEQRQTDTGYRFLPESTFMGYVFSRGYDYKDVPKFQKLSGNYVFPVAYPDLALGGWYYLRRLYSTVFFDSTYVQSTKLDSTLNSYGAELRFESVILRFLPITFGGRVVQRLLDNKVRGEFFLATGVGF